MEAVSVCHSGLVVPYMNAWLSGECIRLSWGTCLFREYQPSRGFPPIRAGYNWTFHKPWQMLTADTTLTTLPCQNGNLHKLSIGDIQMTLENISVPVFPRQYIFGKGVSGLLVSQSNGPEYAKVFWRRDKIR